MEFLTHGAVDDVNADFDILMFVLVYSSWEWSWGSMELWWQQLQGGCPRQIHCWLQGVSSRCRRPRRRCRWTDGRIPCVTLKVWLLFLPVTMPTTARPVFSLPMVGSHCRGLGWSPTCRRSICFEPTDFGILEVWRIPSSSCIFGRFGYTQLYLTANNSTVACNKFKANAVKLSHLVDERDFFILSNLESHRSHSKFTDTWNQGSPRSDTPSVQTLILYYLLEYLKILYKSFVALYSQY